MARKVRGFERELGVGALFGVAYGEIAASVYFSLGIVASQALGLTPVVLLASGLLFLVVALSYAEGSAVFGSGGGSETLIRKAFGDLAGFVAGWALFLDYIIVMALAALFAPHYVGVAFSAPSLRERPWDVVLAVIALVAITVVRLVRHSRVHVGAVTLACLDLVVQALVVVIGLAVLFSGSELVDGFSFADGQGWRSLAFAVPLAMLAFTGLETASNLAAETREPDSVPRSTLSAGVLVVVTTVLVDAVGITALPVEEGETALGTTWLEAPVAGIVTAFDGHLPGLAVDVLRLLVGISGALILLAAATTSVSGVTRLAFSMARHGMLPRELGRLERRTLVSNEAILLVGAAAVVAVLAAAFLGDDDPLFLASAYSFGVLLAFTGAQLAVIRLRIREPDLERPFRARPEIRVRGWRLPLPALVGAPLTAAAWVLAMATHAGARYLGPAWLAAGLAVYVTVRVRERTGLLAEVEPRTLPPTAVIDRVLVPMKLGDIGEEMIATAIALAKAGEAEIEALYVVRVPRRFPLEGALPPDVAAAAAGALAEAEALGDDHGVVVHSEVVSSRSIGHAIVAEATRRKVDVIVMGSSPRWRRQSRFFSPTVDHVLRHAPCQVVVVAFPEGVFEEGVGGP
jgi:basic amino acid/polyamine antiporter, APA family